MIVLELFSRTPKCCLSLANPATRRWTAACLHVSVVQGCFVAPGNDGHQLPDRFIFVKGSMGGARFILVLDEQGQPSHKCLCLPLAL